MVISFGFYSSPGLCGVEVDPRNCSYQMPGLSVELSQGVFVGKDLTVTLVDAKPLDPLSLSWAVLIKVQGTAGLEWFLAVGNPPLKGIPVGDGPWEELKILSRPFIPGDKVVRLMRPRGQWLDFAIRDGHPIPLSDDWALPVVKKPVIYLYPPSATAVMVKPLPHGVVVESDPPLGGGWRVVASPDGSLSSGGRSLYYECILKSSVQLEDWGWHVRADHLLEDLKRIGSAVGLSELEAGDFASYWAHQLQGMGDLEARPFRQEFVLDDMPIFVWPTPDVQIRVMMAFLPFKGGHVKASAPSPPRRRGFTLVEWGGVVLKDQ